MRRLLIFRMQIHYTPDGVPMIRDLDAVSLTFTLWEQSRKDLLALEEKLIQIRRTPSRDVQEIEQLDQHLSVLRVKTERLLGQAIDALRDHRERGNTGK
jgi:hypothetical protein